MSFIKLPQYFWQLSSSRFNFIYALFVMAAYNIPFINAVYEKDRSFVAAALIVVCIFLVLNIALSVLFIRPLVKPLAIVFCLLNASALYFMNAYGVVIDKIMLMNVIQTDVYEVADLLNLKMALYLILLGIIPSYLIYKTDIAFKPLKADVQGKLTQGLIFALVAGGIIGGGLLHNPDTLKEHKHLKNALIPVNYIGAVISVVKIKAKYWGIELKTISEGARMLPQKEGSKPALIVVVIGESARDASFSLSGYERPTNEPLAKYADELVYFDNFYSCGTATAVSLPCIFSPYPRKKFEPESERYTENVLDVISRAGYKLLWRENNTDCKDNCNRIEQERFCNVKECPDEILLTDFAEKVRSFDRPALVVLHQRGSHGPLYALRYPKEFEIYRPVCRREFLQDCTLDELRNTYDNTVYYTSHMLARTIDELKALSDEYDTAFFFTSDHGESLGENGVYLHSAPYDEAPDVQKHIPAMFWFSEGYAEANGLDIDCVRKIRSEAFSHDNVFHTLLGMSRVETPFYDRGLDILARCRKCLLPAFGRAAPQQRIFFRPRRIAAALQQFRQQIIAAPVRQNVNTADRRRTAAGRFRQRKRPVENFATGHVGKNARFHIFAGKTEFVGPIRRRFFRQPGINGGKHFLMLGQDYPFPLQQTFKIPAHQRIFPAAAEQKIKRWQRHCRGYVTEIIDKAVRA